MNCLIIDDNIKTTHALQQFLEKQPNVGQVHKALLPYMVRSLLACERIDVIFIRVRLWDYRQFENIEQKPVIVFLSGGKDKLTNQPQTGVRYSLREPYNALDMSSLLKKIEQEKFIESPTFLFLRYDGRFHKIQFSDIDLIERKQGSYVQFYLHHASPLLPGSLTGWLPKLPQGEFVRVSDTLIVPISEVQKIRGEVYEYKGKVFQLTFRFASAAKHEMENWQE